MGPKRYKLHHTSIPTSQKLGVLPLVSLNPSTLMGVCTVQRMEMSVDREIISNFGAEQEALTTSAHEEE
jgi:hypothetical protein